MRNILAIKSIPLEKETIAAWKEGAALEDVELKFARRGWDHGKLLRVAYQHDIFLNLGNTDLPDSIRDHAVVVNHPDTIRYLSTPGALRRSVLGENHIPPIPKVNGGRVTEDYWFKHPGFAGRGKRFVEAGGQLLGAGLASDTQKHIEGTEYRVNTVGLHVVQVHEKNMNLIINGVEDWIWVGVLNAPKNVKRIVRHALAKLVEHDPNMEWSTFGFDVIDDGNRAWIIEINTCPGVSAPTAARIVRQLKMLYDEPDRGDIRVRERLAWTKMFG